MTTKIAIGEVLALVLPLLFVGCLSTTAEVAIEPYEPQIVQTEYSNNSHQYWMLIQWVWATLLKLLSMEAVICISALN